MSILLAHLWGDYMLQNDWIANNKTKSSLVAAVHSLIHVLSFSIFVANPSLTCLLVVGITHFFIDRFSIVKKWSDGMTSYEPFRFWLGIVRDNTVHLTINFLAYLYL